MLKLEFVNLSSIVNFSKISIQKFDNVEVRGNNMLLTKDSTTITREIENSVDLVSSVITNELYKGKIFIGEKISLNDLKNLPVIDYAKQREIKVYIDDLVFALYFNIDIDKIGLNLANQIKQTCQRNKFYKIVNTN